ncbi:uncharacterized protein LOC111020051 [Momordica charantia]|uniref:Uncharacterized protein LOC111020051 n=1 Tax=Momordica charantia TaxID=3673 RepID=A0A6J1DEI1_MOMCH|nr:uncharacterized protein LOC111020051 [Momordica charantia]
MTDLGVLRNFLGLEVSYSSVGISVNQAEYARDVLTWFGMLASKLCHTPIALIASSDVGSPCTVENAHTYRAMVGALQYLTFTRSDITFSVGKLSQHMHAPYVFSKRVLRYINGFLHAGLLFKKSGSIDEALRLRAFSDSDWAGDTLSIDDLLLDLLFSWAQILYLGLLRNSPLFLRVLWRLNIELLPSLRLKFLD